MLTESNAEAATPSHNRFAHKGVIKRLQQWLKSTVGCSLLHWRPLGAFSGSITRSLTRAAPLSSTLPSAVCPTPCTTFAVDGCMHYRSGDSMLSLAAFSTLQLVHATTVTDLRAAVNALPKAVRCASAGSQECKHGRSVGAEQTVQVTYDKLKEVRAVSRGSGLWGDMVCSPPSSCDFLRWQGSGTLAPHP